MEIWKDIKGYEGLYQVSNLGNIKSFKGKKERILKSCLAGDRKKDKAYYSVNLSKANANKMFKIHRLIAEAFLENPENKPQVNHINGDKKDNRLENLEWVTVKENIHHAWISGLVIKPHNKDLDKHTADVYQEIKAMKLKGYTNIKISRVFNIHQSTVSRIVHDKQKKRIII